MLSRPTILALLLLIVSPAIALMHPHAPAVGVQAHASAAPVAVGADVVPCCGCPPASDPTTTVNGGWVSSRHAVFTIDPPSAGNFSAHGSGWTPTAHGHVLPNGSFWLEFSDGNRSTGTFTNASHYGTTLCWWTRLEWAAPPAGYSAGDQWCKVNSAGCSAPPAPPPAPPAPSKPLPPIQQLYPMLHGGSFSGASVASSPDPLVGYRWDASTIAKSTFQEFRRQPVQLLGEASATFVGASSLLNSTTGSMHVSGVGSVAFDFGSECAGWLQFRSPDLHLPSSSITVLMSSSEYPLPQQTTTFGASTNNNMGNCSAPATSLGNGTFQLQLNPELYDGLRYGWLYVRAGKGNFQPFTITEFTAVCQVLPINYADRAFEASGPAGAGAKWLEEVWYTSTYTTRVDLLEQGFGSILMDRGDRISWTGDAHIAQKAALSGFGGDFGTAFVKRNCIRTQGGDNGIISYDMYFVLSAVDYFLHSKDDAALASWGSLIEQKFETAISFWAADLNGSNPSAGFQGHDDRLGSGLGADSYETRDGSGEEMRGYYKMLSIRAAREYARAVAQCGTCNSTMRAAAVSLDAEFAGYFARNRSLITTNYGIHAATNAVLTSLTTPAEEQHIYEALLSNPAHVCSFAPFNTYFILEAASRLRLSGGRKQAMQVALQIVHRCFYGMNRLGATTYWEVFVPTWVSLFESEATKPGSSIPNGDNGFTSHCHPWSSGAAPWLTHAVAGLQPISAGWSNFSVQPFLDPTVKGPFLLSAVRGVQTLPGDRAIVAEFACVVGGGTSGNLTVPANTTAGIVAVPLCGCSAVGTKLTLNGKPVAAGGVEIGDDCLIVRDLAVGHYKILIVATATQDSVLPTPASATNPSYRDRFISADYTTRGKWRTDGGYGTAGHLMWSWANASVNDQRLPPFISAVELVFPNTWSTYIFPGPATLNWISPTNGSCTADPRALEPSDPSNASACAGLGAQTGTLTATLDIIGEKNRAVNVTLFAVDYDRLGRRFIVDVREYQTGSGNLQLAAPTQYVDNCTEGVYLTWEVHLPVRLRISQVAPRSMVSGDLPVDAQTAFSALFFQ